MNIPKYSLENQKIIYFFLAVMLIGGIYSFFKLPKKEDSPFVIKQAVLVTQYPGATPQEVEKLVTEPIEREIQAMSDVFQIKSESYFGMSKISIELQPTLSPDYMPVKWDELRRKVANIQPRLPSGASSISVSDDFGDVFGIYYALTADEGYTYDDLRNWAQKIKTELSPVPGVQENGLLNKQVRYEFQYNENGKVSEKKAFRWDRTNDEWVPFYQITYQYDDQSGEIKTNYGMWDKKKKNFSLNVQNMIIPSTNYEEIFS